VGAGLRFEDLLWTYPPMSHTKWALVESSVNLDASGNPDPYFIWLDLATARHPLTLLATHFNGRPLTVDYGAPLRLLVPVDDVMAKVVEFYVRDHSEKG
jgi:DMSO/TMAO reductase YedYZ molybdopterin-dependent catalytic subunit